MTNKLDVIINSLKYQSWENFTIWNEISCTKLQLPPEPLTRGLPPPDPHFFCPQLNLLNPPPPRKKFLGTPLLSRMQGTTAPVTRERWCRPQQPSREGVCPTDWSHSSEFHSEHRYYVPWFVRPNRSNGLWCATCLSKGTLLNAFIFHNLRTLTLRLPD